MFLLVYPGLVSNFIALKYEFIGMVANIKHLLNIGNICILIRRPLIRTITPSFAHLCKLIIFIQVNKNVE